MQADPWWLNPQNAAAFQAPSVAAAYRYRPPYPTALFPRLVDLIGDRPRRVLDAGCGPGPLARPLAPLVAQVDAVDPAPAMIAAGHAAPGGDHPRLRWIAGRAEDAPLDPPYGLIVAGDSLHWMEWAVVLPRFARLLASGGFLAVVHNNVASPPWGAELGGLIARYSVMQQYQPLDLIAVLEERGLFHKAGEDTIGPVSFTQSITDYIESFHSRSSLSRDRLTPEAAAAFDAELRAILAPHCGDVVELQQEIGLIWGTPRQPGTNKAE
jgi:SAM-dependent methyltransferase